MLIQGLSNADPLSLTTQTNIAVFWPSLLPSGTFIILRLAQQDQVSISSTLSKSIKFFAVVSVAEDMAAIDASLAARSVSAPFVFVSGRSF